MKTPLASVFCLLLAGCASADSGEIGFSQAYVPNRALSPMADFAPHVGTQISHSPDLVQDEAYFTTHEYALLGVSTFIGGIKINRYGLAQLAESLQADVVLWAMGDADSPSPFVAMENLNLAASNAKPATTQRDADSTSPAPEPGVHYRYSAVFLRKLR